MKRARTLLILTLVLTDAGMSLLASGVAYLIRSFMKGPALGPFTQYLPLAAVQVVNTLIVFFLYKFYHRRHAATLLDEIYRIFGAVTVATLLTLAVTAFLPRDSIPYQRSLIVLTWAASLVTITLGRFAHNRLHHWVQRRGKGVERVLIVGTGEVGHMILQKVQQTPGLGYQVVGFASANGGPSRVLGLPVLGTIDDIPRIIESSGSTK
jgi:FlaA1/EpsC-like NDP-sugar epimerase